ncbi:hypothetical protein [Tenacibaculum aquimarinum]|uniref:hypothetical protein n=1 Tax=Tenacibaculum aquimarinum TaxID=2910675 RepID=UPI001F0A87A1|nr:hypothetical protein [Tenacibaculum aquimarinum]MCH3884118.1 hypothetical protein [Tenacibaculum aquimarinum]
MKKYILLFSLLTLLGCQDYGKLTVVTDLPNTLKEVSGTEITRNSDLIWMLNDSGNKPHLYGLSYSGKIDNELKIQAKNHDWEDLTSDKEGNLYIGDFGNNDSKRQNLAILKVNHQDLMSKSEIEIERIRFSYPEQTKFPAKKKIDFLILNHYFIGIIAYIFLLKAV